MCTISITVPDEFLSEKMIATDQASTYVRMIVAIGLYSNGDATVERAAQIAGINVDDLRLALAQCDNRAGQDGTVSQEHYAAHGIVTVHDGNTVMDDNIVMNDNTVMDELLGELEKGRRSGEEHGYIPSNVVRERLHARLEAKMV